MADEEPELFIKGYKIDHDKIRDRYGTGKMIPKTSDFCPFGESFPYLSSTLQLEKNREVMSA